MQKASAANINNLGLSTSNTNHLSTKSAINSSQTSPTQIILSNNSSSLSPVNNGIPANSSYQQPQHHHHHQQQQHSQQSHHTISTSTGSPLISPAPISQHHPQHSHQHYQHHPTTTSNYINSISTSNAIGFSSLPSTSSAINDSSIVKEEIKTHFSTGEGIYKKMTVATYSRPNKPTMGNTFKKFNKCLFIFKGSIAVPNCPVRVSIQGTPNLNSPIDKRIYKGTFPTCHDFNQETARSDVCSLIIGFSAGQIQLIDPLRKDFVPSKLFNEERNIDKTPVTCVKWIPGQPTNFMVSHQSGNIYLYNEAFSCFVDNPVYQIFKQVRVLNFSGVCKK
uniref:Uncharacterized protein n=1 Tax=Panagrolaimus davidi TaxID=227884 RepID=A0A914Q604_9BILA